MINEIHFGKPPQLETQRLLLRPLSLDDAGDMQRIRSDERVMAFMDSERHTALEHSVQFITENLKAYQNKKGLFWALTLKSTGRFIGDFSYWDINHKHARAEIGYTLHPDHWGQGFMNEALQTLLRFGFQDLNLHSIEANINPKNDTSRKLLLRLGFVKEAYFREHYYYNGQFIDSEIYSLLEEDLKD